MERIKTKLWGEDALIEISEYYHYDTGTKRYGVYITETDGRPIHNLGYYKTKAIAREKANYWLRIQNG